MALKKSDLYRSLWASCDELRGGMDASQYKDYILTLLFVKYVTDKAKTDPNSLIEIPEGGSFDDLVALRGDKEIGDKINKSISLLAETNDLVNVLGLVDFNDEEKLGKGKEMQDRLSKLVAIFNDLDFTGSRAGGDDLLGDAYEYLMRHFATESGKSKGQFYTPAEVSRVLARVVGIGPETSQDETVYDPTCGSGSLLLKAADEAPRGMSIYGQEKDNATWALARMNMILHSYEDAVVRKGDTITNPQFTKASELQTFDYAVANPPFSTKSWDNGLDQEYGRFEYGYPPNKNGDYAFLLHILKSLKSTGKAAVILPHGVLFRGNAEATIRRQLLTRGYIKAIIGLPANLFYGTGIPACVIVLDKEDARDRKHVFMIDASRGFRKDGNKNRLRSQDIHKIVDVFNKQSEIAGYSRLVPLVEIAGEMNSGNLNIPRYIDSSEREDRQDLGAHLGGGIPNRDLDALAPYWEAFPSLRNGLFKSNRPGYSDLAISVTDVQQRILDSEEFTVFQTRVRAEIAAWFEDHRSALLAIDATTRPNDLIATLGDDLLARFRTTPLLDEYDVYEQLLSYWHETMHDDVFLVMNQGWVEASRPRVPLDDRDRKLNEIPDIVIGSGKSAKKFKTDLIPPDPVIAKYLSDVQAEIDELEVTAGESSSALEAYIEEHAVEGGALWGAVDDGKITRSLVTQRLQKASEEDSDEEVSALQNALDMYAAEAGAKKALKAGQNRRDLALVEQYGKLETEDVQVLLLDAKWHSCVRERVESVADQMFYALAARVRQLGDRYASTLADIDNELNGLEVIMTRHLKALGAVQ